MCNFAEPNGNSSNTMCWCFEEITLMILVQRILMYLWYRLLLKMFPRLSVLPNCHDCTGPRRSLPCGQLADEYWKASQFTRTVQQTTGRCYDKALPQPFAATVGFCNHKPADTTYVFDCIEPEEEDQEYSITYGDISPIYQSTFLEDFDECLLPEDIDWDVPVSELKQKPFQEQVDFALLANDFYIDDNLDDHLYAAEFHTAIGKSLFCDSWID